MEYQIGQGIKTRDFIAIRESVGWGTVTETLAQQIIQSSNYIITVYDGEHAVASARTYTQGADMIFIADVMVLKEYQRMGIGTLMIQHILDYYWERHVPDKRIYIKLVSAKGKEVFYEKLGFIREEEGSQTYGQMF